MKKIKKIAGTAFHLSDENIDTDRIIPARYLKCVSFNGIEAHAFEDDRAKVNQEGGVHPFDDPENKSCNILVTDTNFGCGSSREHAVQCIMRSGIEVIVSCTKPGSPGFAEIFRGNCAANGIPCVELDETSHKDLVEFISQNKGVVVSVDIVDRIITAESLQGSTIMRHVAMNEGHREMLITGRWDTIAVLLEAGDAIEQTALKLPYLNPAVLSG